MSQVAAAARIAKVPASVEPTPAQAGTDFGGNDESIRCQARLGESREHICVLGDPQGTHLMVLYGDSHALMWLPAFVAIAQAAHWRLIVLGKSDCPAGIVTVANPPGIGLAGGPYLGLL